MFFYGTEHVRVIYIHARKTRSIFCGYALLFGFTAFAIINSAGLFDFLSVEWIAVRKNPPPLLLIIWNGITVVYSDWRKSIV